MSPKSPKTTSSPGGSIAPNELKELRRVYDQVLDGIIPMCIFITKTELTKSNVYKAVLLLGKGGDSAKTAVHKELSRRVFKTSHKFHETA